MMGILPASGGRKIYRPRCAVFDGSNDYITATSITGISDGSTVSLSFVCKFPTTEFGDLQRVIELAVTGTLRFQCHVSVSGNITIQAYDTGGTLRVALTIYRNFLDGAAHLVTVTFDKSNVSLRGVYVDVQDASWYSDWSTYSATGSLDLTCNQNSIGAQFAGTQKMNGTLGMLYLSDTYITASTLHSGMVDANGFFLERGAQGGDLPSDTNKPEWWLNEPRSGAIANWPTNKGTGGTLTLTGTLTDNDSIDRVRKDLLDFSEKNFAVTLGSGVAQVDVTIGQAVDTTRAVIIYSGCQCDFAASDNGDAHVYHTLLNSTTIRSIRSAAAAQTVQAKPSILDFSPDYVEAIEYGTTTMGNTGTSQTITPAGNFPLDQSMIFLEGFTSTATGHNPQHFPSVLMTNNNEATLYRQAAQTGTMTVSYCFVRFVKSKIKSLTHVAAVALASTATSWTAALPNVDPAKCLIAYGGGGASFAGVTAYCAGELTNATTFTAYCGVATLGDRAFRCSILEWEGNLPTGTGRNSQNIGFRTVASTGSSLNMTPAIIGGTSSPTLGDRGIVQFMGITCDSGSRLNVDCMVSNAGGDYRIERGGNTTVSGHTVFSRIYDF